MALVEILGGLAIAAATYAALRGVGYLAVWVKDRFFTKPPVLQGDELTVLDTELANQTAERIKDVIGPDPVSVMSTMTSSQKVAVIEEITKELVSLYQLTDVNYKTVTMDNSLWGYYCEDDKTLYINISQLLYDKNNISGNAEDFDKMVIKETLDTVVHELRHAIQFRAAFNLDDDYLNISRERRIEWAKNIANYISPKVDPERYITQLIERDAIAFAHEAMKGVFGDE